MLEDSTRRYYEDNAEDYINKTSNVTYPNIKDS